MASSYTAALEQAKEEMRQVEADLTRLHVRKTVLEGLIKTLGNVLNGSSPKPQRREYPMLPPHSLIPLNVSGPEYLERMDFLWIHIAQTMYGRASFTLGEAGETMEELRGDMGHTRSQQVRNAITRHPETFQRNADGTYTVTSLPKGRHE
jgi:hypothetical protein